MSVNQPYKVLIVDDSRTICRFLEKILSANPDLDVVGYALDAYEAREMIKQLNPDVLTLDIEMPRMDGLTFLRNLMRLRPMPVVMISSLTDAGAQATLDALEAGAVDFMVKRHSGSDQDLNEYAKEIVKRVKSAAQVRINVGKAVVRDIPLPDLTDLRRRMKLDRAPSNDLKRLIAIGASTGGPEALRQILTDFYASDCALVICQHMPERFMQPFATRLNGTSRFSIKLAEDGEKIEAGRGYVAPGDMHLTVVKRSSSLYCQLNRDATVSGHRPSVDVLFTSIAKQVEHGILGVLLTGMGKDGADGLALMHDGGTPTIVQDEESSAVWGMPGRAYEMQAADEALSLRSVGPVLNALLH